MSYDEITVEVFTRYVAFMLQEKRLQQTTANVRIRNMRAFIRFFFKEGWSEEPIHERLKPIKTPDDEIQSFTPSEIKAMLNQTADSIFVEAITVEGYRRLVAAIDDETYLGFRTKVT